MPKGSLSQILGPGNGMTCSELDLVWGSFGGDSGSFDVERFALLELWAAC